MYIFENIGKELMNRSETFTAYLTYGLEKQ